MGDRFDRSEQCGPTVTEGFRVRRALAPLGERRYYVVVEYEPGTRRARSGTPKGLLALTQRALGIYERNLKVRYAVARNDEGGADDWNCLLVRKKEEENVADGFLERIASGRGVLTDGERAALEAVAEASGKPKTVFQVYDDTGITDNDMIGTEKAGGQFVSSEAAVEWAERQELESFSVYQERRCITRKQEIWYISGSSPVYSAN
jgi:hypothetical protein